MAPEHVHPYSVTLVFFTIFTKSFMSATAPSHFSRDARRLLSLTDALVHSGSQLEDTWWDDLLTEQLQKILTGKNNRTTESVMEFLAEQAPDAYEILFEKAESLSESVTLEHDGELYDALLFSAPIIAWTRYKLPDGHIEPEQRARLLQAMLDTVATDGAFVLLSHNLLNFDVMPQSFHETRSWTQQMAEAALAGRDTTIGATSLPSSDGILADTRFLVGVIVVPKGQALFRWQVSDAQSSSLRQQARREWAAACADILGPVFTGCHTQYLTPDAYYTNNRESDHQIRPFVVRSAVTWLNTAVNLSGSQLRAVIVGCGDGNLQEYRVGFSARGDKTVIYGCVWPVLTKEEAFSEFVETDMPNIADQITAILKEEGVTEVRRMPGLQPCDFCEDCGAPYFPDSLGELQHPELPDEASLEPVQFH